MERTLEKVVRVLEKIERDLSGIKDELAYIRKEQTGPHKRSIGLTPNPTVTITQEGVKKDETGQQHIRKER